MRPHWGLLMRFVVYPLVAAAIYGVLINMAIHDFIQHRRQKPGRPLDF